MNNLNLEEAYRNYFSVNSDEKDCVNNETTYSYDLDTTPPKSKASHLTAKGNINTINEFAKQLSMLLNIAWGSSWGTLEPASSVGDDPERITVPKITYDVNLREISPGTNLKPQLIDTITEIVDGVPTGDSFNIYKQSFDCIIEFNIYSSTSLDTEELMQKFEDILLVHAGDFKEAGVNEIFFLKEVPSKYSLNFTKSSTFSSKCLLYFIRIDKYRKIRVNQIKDIRFKLNMQKNQNS